MSPEHQFQYSTSWYYLDLSEIEELVHSQWMLGRGQFSAAAFRREDHFGDPEESLAQAVHRLVETQTGMKLSGPVRLLTQLRHFGLYFSPVSIFYCFDEHDALRAMVAEVSNTPWNERHCYVLWDGNRSQTSPHRYSHRKEFHVSPFMGMDTTYDWSVRPPTERLHVGLGCLRDGQRIFQADVMLRRHELGGVQIFASIMRRPVAGLHVLAAIYFQALRLWMKKCQFYPHPSKSTTDPAGMQVRSQSAAGHQPLD